MTVIAGFVAGEDVWMGADSAVWTGGLEVSDPQAKVFGAGPLMIGTSGDVRIGDLLRHVLDVSDFTCPSMDSARTVVVRDLIPLMRECLNEGKALELKDGRPRMNGGMLVAYRGHLFILSSDFGVVECSCGFGAIGSGAEVAMGSMWTTTSGAGGGRLRVLDALEACAALVAGVSGPFVVECLRGQSSD